MKRGDTYLVEIKEYRPEGLLVYLKIADQTLLLPAGEIKDGIKQKHKKMLGWFIPVRIKSLRPLAVTNMRLDKTQLYRMGLKDSKPVERVNGVSKTSVEKVQAKEETSKTVEEKPKNIIKKLDVRVKSFQSGFMVWWKKINDAALYTIRLFINQDEIDVITKERTTSYHSFVNMARIHQTSDYGSSTGLNYYVTVVAEDREGKIIAASDSITARV
jgi:hypothetical protein